MTDTTAFGLVIIGDELLDGDRCDRHFEFFRGMLRARGLGLAWCWLLPDDRPLLVRQLRRSLEDGGSVFCCGGIGATPDDLTRQCAAEAAGVPLVRHPGAVAEIEGRFGADAYPQRILMADLPEGSELIPNPYNRIPGFGLRRHHFLPGFPEMAWPMAEWVLENRYPQGGRMIRERSVLVTGVAESDLVPLMERLQPRYPDLKLFSLPRLGEARCVELGFRGRGDAQRALDELKRLLAAAGFATRSG